ncbi:MAG: PepSY-associated TM helix domain-containing protein [Acidobacteriota bacterium]
MRKLATSLHRYVGLTTAAFLFVIGLTGALLAFYDELDAWFAADLRRAPATDSPLTVGQIVDRVETAIPEGRVTYVHTPPEPGHSIMVRVSPRPGSGVEKFDFSEIFVDPESGRELGRRDWGCCLERKNFMPWVYRLHYTLHAPGRIGVWLLGGVALLWALDCFVALYLTLPRRRPFFLRWWPAFKVKTDGGAQRFNYDLHRASGLWLWAVLFVLAFSGVYFNLNREVFRPVVEVFSDLTPYPYEYRDAVPPEEQAPILGYDEALQRALAEAERQGWPTEARGVALSHAQQYYSVYLQPFDDLRFGMAGPTLFIDSMNGTLVDDRVPLEGSAADVLFSLQYPLHSGKIGGLLGRIIICLAGLATAVLSVTGVIIWARKRRARMRGERARRQKRAPALEGALRPEPAQQSPAAFDRAT